MVLARLRHEIGTRRRPAGPPPSDYRDQLLRLFHAYVSDSFPAAADRDEFLRTAGKWLIADETKKVARYLSDLWVLFEPDFREKLPRYYESLALVNTMRFIEYAADEAFIRELYLRPYELAAERFSTLDVLEVGAGIPHGLIRFHAAHPGRIASVTLNDIDAPYTRFALWFCAREGIPADWLPAVAGESSRLPKGRFNFIFAKDALEHLRDPAVMVEEILGSAGDAAILALDLQDKGPVVYQHVSPQLEPLRSLLVERQWAEIGTAGPLNFFQR